MYIGLSWEWYGDRAFIYTPFGREKSRKLDCNIYITCRVDDI